MKWTHADLQADLAMKIETPFVNCHMGSAWIDRTAPIADIVKIYPSFTRFAISIYEVKASRADFLSDIRSGKWEKYMPFCHRFYFSVASGIANRDEIPAGVGLYVRGDRGWTCVKQAVVRRIEPDIQMLQALIFYRQKISNGRRWITWQFGWSERAEKKLKRLGIKYKNCFACIKK